jgi:hypothetical protein
MNAILLNDDWNIMDEFLDRIHSPVARKQYKGKLLKFFKFLVEKGLLGGSTDKERYEAFVAIFSRPYFQDPPPLANC